VTTDGQPKLISRAREAGAKGWLMKPIKEDLLIIPVRRLAGDA
jgi:two-component system chemotaxis response regulator CheY